MRQKLPVVPMWVALMTCLYIFFASTANGDIFDITASADARVLSFFPNSNEGNGALLSVFNNPGNIQRTYLYFDLSSQAGLTATGDGTLSLMALGDGNNSVTNGSLYVAFSNWDENTITWNNQPGSLGAPLDTVSGIFTQSVTWNVPQATLQIWLNSPASNAGLTIFSDVGSTLTFHSRQNPAMALPPRLVFNAVPEPTSTILLGCAVIAFGIRRNRLTMYSPIR